MACKHNNFDGGCAAFFEGIPFRFTAGQHHDRPTPDQGNDIVFEWIDRIEQRARMKKIVADRVASSRHERLRQRDENRKTVKV
jgi:hypothetical protein